MKRIGPLGSTLLGVHLLVVGLIGLAPLAGFGLVATATAIAAGVLILMGR